MLGPSIVVASTPIAAVTAALALRNAPDRPWALVSAVLAALELIFLLVMLIILTAGR